MRGTGTDMCHCEPGYVQHPFLHGELRDGYQLLRVPSKVETRSDPAVSSLAACAASSLFCLNIDYPP